MLTLHLYYVGHTLGMIKNAYVRIYQGEQEYVKFQLNGKILKKIFELLNVRYNWHWLPHQGGGSIEHTAMLMGKLYCKCNGSTFSDMGTNAWMFKAIGYGTTGTTYGRPICFKFMKKWLYSIFHVL